MTHLVHGRGHHHVAAVLAKPEIAVTARLGRGHTRRIVDVDELREVRVGIVELDRRIHHGRNALVGVLLVGSRVRGLVERVGDLGMRKNCRKGNGRQR